MGIKDIRFKPAFNPYTEASLIDIFATKEKIISSILAVVRDLCLPPAT